MIIAAGISESRNGFLFTRKGGFPHWTLSYLVRGENEKTVGKHMVTRRAPYIALTRPNIPYRVATTPGHLCYLEHWAIFTPKPEWSRLLDWPGEQHGALYLHLSKPAVDGMLRRAFCDLLAFRRDMHPEKEGLAENALERILLLMQKYREPCKNRIADDRVQRVVGFLNTEFRTNISLKDIAAHVHLSPSRLAHLFTKNAGMAPFHYLELQRIEAAKSLLLSTNDPINAVAGQVGFENPYHFSTRFRRRVGVSPKRFREQNIRRQ